MIAEFMGYNFDDNVKEYYVPKYNSGDWFTIDELSFNESWDWLMPVVDSIYNTGMDEQTTNEIGDVTHALLDINMQSTYDAVCKFIEMYNENK